MVKIAGVRNLSGIVALTVLLLSFSVVLIVFDSRGKIGVIRSTVQTYLSGPIKSSTTWVHSSKRYFSLFFTERDELRTKNTQLKKEIVWLKANLANQTVLEAEYRRLKSLFESTAIRTRPVMIAEVLDSQIDASKHQIEINKGLLANVFTGQIVIDENGIVGQVTKILDNAALVSLITDERQRIPVFVARNRVRMIARGTGQLDELEMEFVNKSADVRVGDKIVTSGLGNRYPRGYGVATVLTVESSPTDEFLIVKAKPLAALDKIFEVLLIQPID